MTSTKDDEFLKKVSFHPINTNTNTNDELKQCIELEKASYPEDEAASPESLLYRLNNASPYFRCAHFHQNTNNTNTTTNTKIIGFICGTRCDSFDHDSLSTHISSGKYLAIHSVVVEQTFRRKKVARTMIQNYIHSILSFEKQQQQNERSKNNNSWSPIEKIVLMAKAHLLPFYIDSGFACTKKSDIVHGLDPWYELELDLSSKRLHHHQSPSASTTGEEEDIPCWVIDAFSRPSFFGNSGNPAAVVICPKHFNIQKETSIHWMRTVAIEFNHAETAFLWPNHHDNNNNKDMITHWNIRYYTCNGSEVKLCGHATLASAFVLFNYILLPSMTTMMTMNSPSTKEVQFQTCATQLSATTTTTTTTTTGNSNKTNGTIAMDFPWRSIISHNNNNEFKSNAISMIQKAFHNQLNESNILFIGLDEEGEDLFVELTFESFMNISGGGSNDDSDSESSFVEPNYMDLTLWNGYTRGVLLCCQAPQTKSKSIKEENNSQIDFYSRFFGPKVGIPEDPVTGSAHSALGPYFGSKTNRDFLIGMQMSKRGGMVQCQLKRTEQKVTIVGNATATVIGTLHIQLPK